MLAKEDLEKLSTLIDAKLDIRLKPIHKELKILNKKVDALGRKLDLVIRSFDREYIGIHQRVARIENHLGIRN